VSDFGRHVTGKERPPWWQPFARRRWDRTVAFAYLIEYERLARISFDREMSEGR
jgi:hypothetical protein